MSEAMRQYNAFLYLLRKRPNDYTAHWDDYTFTALVKNRKLTAGLKDPMNHVLFKVRIKELELCED